MLMQRNKVRRLPVTDGGRLVGMLSVSDLFIRSSQQGSKADGLRPEALVRTLGMISEPIGDIASERERIARGVSTRGASPS